MTHRPGLALQQQILDARYERVREEGVVGRRAVLIALGVNQDGRRCVLGVGLANRESRTSWKDFLVSLLNRGPARRRIRGQR